MFHSFFPRPRLFFLSFAVWALVCVLFWFNVAADHGRQFSLGNFVGYDYPAAVEKTTTPEAATESGPSDNAGNNEADEEKPDTKPPAPTPEEIAAQEQTKSADKFWLYQYSIIVYGLFVIFWMWFSPHP